MNVSTTHAEAFEQLVITGQGVYLIGAGLPELLRNGKAAEQSPKEKRLRSLARRAGDLCVSAYLGGNRDRAIFFNEKRKRILWSIWTGAQGEKDMDLTNGNSPRYWVDFQGRAWKEPEIKGRLKMRIPGHAALRQYVIERDQGACIECGAASDLVADHIVSRRNGGRHHPSNMQCLCVPCNARKAALVDSKGGRNA